MSSRYSIINKSNTFITLELGFGSKTIGVGQRLNNINEDEISSRIKYLASQGSIAIIATEKIKPKVIKTSNKEEIIEKTNLNVKEQENGE